MSTKKIPGKLSQAAATLGKVGGKSGGAARARALTASQRSEIARKGGKAKAKNKKK